MLTRTQIHLPKEELDALHRAAKRHGTTVAQLVREAVRRVWLVPETAGPAFVDLWNGPARQTSADHDAIYDKP
jgi:hypothetical protein